MSERMGSRRPTEVRDFLVDEPPEVRSIRGRSRGWKFVCFDLLTLQKRVTRFTEPKEINKINNK